MKITKKPKVVKIKRCEMKEVSYLSEYICPTCKTGFKGFGPRGDVTRFKCECGQELIVS